MKLLTPCFVKNLADLLAHLPRRLALERPMPGCPVSSDGAHENPVCSLGSQSNRMEPGPKPTRAESSDFCPSVAIGFIVAIHVACAHQDSFGAHLSFYV